MYIYMQDLDTMNTKAAKLPLNIEDKYLSIRINTATD